MRNTIVVGGLVALSLALGGAAWAQSKCDARVTTALARKVRCELKTFAAAQEAGSVVNTSRLSGCEATFARKCGKAQAKGGCQAQASSCPELEITADAAVDALRGTPMQTASKWTAPSRGPSARRRAVSSGGRQRRRRPGARSSPPSSRSA